MEAEIIPVVGGQESDDSPFNVCSEVAGASLGRRRRRMHFLEACQLSIEHYRIDPGELVDVKKVR